MDTEYVRAIVCGIVEYPEAVVIEKKVDEMGILITVSVDKTDMGKVIGKEGNIANAMRTLVRAFGLKNHAHLSLKIIEPK